MTPWTPDDGADLRAWRLAHGLTMNALALRVNVAYQTIWCWEHGRRPLPDARRRLMATIRRVEASRENSP